MRAPVAVRGYLDGLRAVAAVVGYYLAAAAFVVPLAVVTPSEWWQGGGGIALSSGATVLGAMLAGTVLVLCGWATWTRLGWPNLRQALRGFAFGAGVGLAMAAAAVALAVFLGTAQVSVTGESASAYLVAGARVLVVLLVAALAEELLFRGYPLARLARTFGKVNASVVLAAVFVVAHAWNPNTSLLGLANIGLAALVLSAAFFTPGRLPAAWGLHVGWNGGLGIGADAPVSGVAFDLPALEFVTGGPNWVTGGSFGPEGGIVTTAVMTGVLIWLARNKTNSREDLEQ